MAGWNDLKGSPFKCPKYPEGEYDWRWLELENFADNHPNGKKRLDLLDFIRTLKEMIREKR